MISQMYNSSIQRYKNPIVSELSLKLGVPVELVTEMTDDQLIARLSGLVDAQIVLPLDANNTLKQKGII